MLLHDTRVAVVKIKQPRDQQISRVYGISVVLAGKEGRGSVLDRPVGGINGIGNITLPFAQKERNAEVIHHLLHAYSDVVQPPHALASLRTVGGDAVHIASLCPKNILV